MIPWQTAAPLWRGHVFLFDKTPARPAYHERIGLRLLLIALALEGTRLIGNAYIVGSVGLTP